MLWYYLYSVVISRSAKKSKGSKCSDVKLITQELTADTCKLGPVAGVSLSLNIPQAWLLMRGNLPSCVLFLCEVGARGQRASLRGEGEFTGQLVPRRMDGSGRPRPRLWDKGRIKGWVQTEFRLRMLKQISSRERKQDSGHFSCHKDSSRTRIIA